MKCATTRATAFLECHEKAERKGVAVDRECTAKLMGNFSDTVTNKGCMEKAEAKPPCATTGDAAPLAAKIDAFVDDIGTDVDPIFPTVVLNKCSAGRRSASATSC
jgi:hypothetical protein